VVFVIDSLSAVTTEKIGEKIDDDGHADLVQPQAANIISTFMKRMSHWYSRYPFIIAGVNHLKLAKDRYGNLNVRNLQGGYAPRFSECLEIEMQRSGKQLDRRSVGQAGISLTVKVAKNSFAPHPTAGLEVEMLWKMEAQPDGTEIQRTWFDWHSSAVELLAKPPVDAATARKVRAVADVSIQADSRTAWCEELGVSESCPLPMHEVGKILEERQDVKEQLYPLLGIRRRVMFRPRKDYHAIIEEARGRAVRIKNDGIPVFDDTKADVDGEDSAAS
jgi:hypothetical protein